MEVKFKIFQSSLESWERLFQQAAYFASSLGKENLINIVHSEDQNAGVIVVWYWAERTSNKVLDL